MIIYVVSTPSGGEEIVTSSGMAKVVARISNSLSRVTRGFSQSGSVIPSLPDFRAIKNNIGRFNIIFFAEIKRQSKLSDEGFTVSYDITKGIITFELGQRET